MRRISYIRYIFEFISILKVYTIRVIGIPKTCNRSFEQGTHWVHIDVRFFMLNETLAVRFTSRSWPATTCAHMLHTPRDQ